MSCSISLIVPYRHDDWGYRENNWWFAWRWWNTFGPPDIEISLSDSGEGQFNRSRARNMAVEKSSGDILIIADADTLVSSVGLTKAISQVVKKDAPWAIPYDWYYNLSQEYSKQLLDADKPSRIDPNDEGFNYEHKILSWAGVLVVPRTAFYAVGGYDERFEGWGHEDVAFRIKLDCEWGQSVRTTGNAYHLWHPIKAEETFNSPLEIQNRKLFQAEYADKYNWKDERLR